MVSPHVDAQRGVVPLSGCHPHFRPEICPLVVKVDQPRGAQQRPQIILQQVAVLAYEGIQQPLVFLSKPAASLIQQTIPRVLLDFSLDFEEAMIGTSWTCILSS